MYLLLLGFLDNEKFTPPIISPNATRLVPNCGIFPALGKPHCPQMPRARARIACGTLD